MKRRLLATFLALCLVLTLLPGTAKASTSITIVGEKYGPGKDHLLSADFRNDEEENFDSKPEPEPEPEPEPDPESDEQFYQITYDMNGGTPGTNFYGSATAGTTVWIISIIPTRDGYTFGGWTDGTRTYKDGDSFVMPAHTVVLKAVWEAVTASTTDLSARNGVKGEPYSWTLPNAVSGGNYSLPVGTLPSGLSLNPSTGEISGTPMATGTWQFTIREKIPGQTVTNDYCCTLQILPLISSTYTIPGKSHSVISPHMNNYCTSSQITNREQTFEDEPTDNHPIAGEFQDVDSKLNRPSQNYTVPIKQIDSSSDTSDNKTTSSSNSTKPASSSSSKPAAAPTPDPALSLPFGDVTEANWFYPGVKWAYDGGVMNGETKSAFAPNKAISQATIVTVLSRMAGIDLDKFAGMTDSTIQSGKWYTNAAIWAKQSGLLPDNSAFTGEETISRDQMAIMLVKYLRSFGQDTTPPEDAVAFADAAQMSADGSAAFQVLYRYNIFRGVGENRMDPAGSTTRAQFAALVHRISDMTA